MPGGERVEILGRCPLQVAEPVEGLGLLIQTLVGRPAQPDDLGEQRPALRLGLRDLVVESLAQLETLHQVRAGLVKGDPELRDRLLAELRLRHAEVLLGGLHRVVDVDQCGAGAVAEVFGAHPSELVRWTRRLPRLRCWRPCAALLLAAPAGTPDQQVGPTTQQRDPADGDDDR